MNLTVYLNIFNILFIYWSLTSYPFAITTLCQVRSNIAYSTWLTYPYFSCMEICEIKNNRCKKWTTKQYQNGFHTESMLSQDFPLKRKRAQFKYISSWIWKLTLCVTATTTCNKPALKVDIMTAALSVSESTQCLLNLSVSLQVTWWLRGPYRITHRVGDVSWN